MTRSYNALEQREHERREELYRRLRRGDRRFERYRERFRRPAATLIQTAQGGSNSTSNTVLLALGSNEVAAGLLVAICCSDDVAGTPATQSVSDSLGNIWAPVNNVLFNFASRRLGVFVAQNIAAGANTITLTTSANVNKQMIVREYSGCLRSGVVDENAVASGASSANMDSGATPTTSQGNELLIGAGGTFAGSGPVVGANYRNFVSQEGFFLAAFAEDRVVSVTGAYNATFTITADDWGCIIVTLALAARALDSMVKTPEIVASQVSLGWY